MLVFNITCRVVVPCNLYMLYLSREITALEIDLHLVVHNEQVTLTGSRALIRSLTSLSCFAL